MHKLLLTPAILIISFIAFAVPKNDGDKKPKPASSVPKEQLLINRMDSLLQQYGMRLYDVRTARFMLPPDSSMHNSNSYNFPLNQRARNLMSQPWYGQKAGVAAGGARQLTNSQYDYI